jgi:glycosyltransferase involved in cell wall biosynthesis
MNGPCLRDQGSHCLFGHNWPEPFGLVMIEAMACGTPVLAFRQGSVSEVVDQGVTGAIVDTVDEAVMMLPRVMELDRRAVRRRFEERFSSTRMATDYEIGQRFEEGASAVSRTSTEAGPCSTP